MLHRGQHEDTGARGGGGGEHGDPHEGGAGEAVGAVWDYLERAEGGREL